MSIVGEGVIVETILTTGLVSDRVDEPNVGFGSRMIPPAQALVPHGEHTARS